MDYGSVLKNIPLHLGLPSHGKVSYCARILPICRAASNSRSERQTDHTPAQSLYVVTGGEDGNVRLFKHAQRALSDHHRALGVKTSSSQAVSDESGGTVAASESSQFLQEVNMPGNVAVKAIAFAVRGKTETQRQIQRDKKRMSKSGDERENLHTEVEINGIQQISMSSGGIVIAVGGRLTYSLWEYNLQPDVSSSLMQYRGDDYEECESPVEGLSFLTSGSVSSSAEQDHRILSVQCVLLPHWYGTYVQNSAKKAARGESKEEERAAGREGQILSTDDTCSSSSSDGDRGGDGGGDDVYLVVMGDSRGIVTVATYEHGFEIDSKGKDIALYATVTPSRDVTDDSSCHATHPFFITRNTSLLHNTQHIPSSYHATLPFFTTRNTPLLESMTETPHRFPRRRNRSVYCHLLIGFVEINLDCWLCPE